MTYFSTESVAQAPLANGAIHLFLRESHRHFAFTIVASP
jgi:hypothetical protein